MVGRLPWKTLGTDQLRDGHGEPLWYMMRGFRDPPINFGSAGQLSYNGATVVAMIIAPGVPLNTAALAGAPGDANCVKQDQMVGGRNSANLSAANFLECGLATGTINAPGDSGWTNDRVIAITAAEWADAIAPAIGDRLQRQVAPAMYDFYNTTSQASWGQRFFPNASPFAAAPPTTNLLCGAVDTFRACRRLPPSPRAHATRPGTASASPVWAGCSAWAAAYPWRPKCNAIST